jgi:transcriptional regulator with XRE-family HTH domain
VKSLRSARKLTQEELGRAVGVDYKHIGAIERGIRAPSFDVIERIAKIFKIEHFQLFLPSDAREANVDAALNAALSEMTAKQRATIRNMAHDLLRIAKKLDPERK